MKRPAIRGSRLLVDVCELVSIIIGIASTMTALEWHDVFAFCGWSMATFWMLQARWDRRSEDRTVAQLEARCERAENLAARQLDGVTGPDVPDEP